MHRIIAITGLKCSGKDAAADYLGKNFGYKNVKIAGNLKQIIKLMFNMTKEHVDGKLKDVVDERWGISPRSAMQFIGTDVMQYKIQEIMPNIKRNFWLQQFLLSIEESQKYIISDVRFKHEVDEIRKKYGGDVYVLKIVRPSLVNEETHASETEWVDIKEDGIIMNDGSLEDLYVKISRMKL
jgi:dephospho-CoA kinase